METPIEMPQPLPAAAGISHWLRNPLCSLKQQPPEASFSAVARKNTSAAPVSSYVGRAPSMQSDELIPAWQ